MTVTIGASLPPAAAKAPARHPFVRLMRSGAGAAGFAWLVLLVGLSATWRLWAPYSPTQQDSAHPLSGPSPEHWLGTDELGRDILTRIFASGGETLATSALGVAVTMLVAIPVALLAASYGGRGKGLIDRTTEIVMSLPGTVILIAVIGAIGVNLPVVMSILGVLFAAGMYRIFVGQAQSLQGQLYVDAARVDGLGRGRISARHVLPGMTSTVLAQASLVFAIGLMIQVGLAFIGFGAPIPEPSWGGMIATASQHVYDAPWMMVPTGVVLALTVLAANAIGDTMSTSPDEALPQIALGAYARRREQRRAALPPAPVATEGAGILRVSDLTIAVDDGATLVSGVSFDLEAGRVLGLVGESGCGKTMTALALIGLLPPGVGPTEGAIVWQARDLVRLPEKQLQTVRGHEIALISQEPMRALDPMFTVGHQIVGAVRRLRGLAKAPARAVAAELLRKVGIVDPDGTLALYPHQISGGMAQRVAIALALAGEPKLLVADEPTTALDVTVQAETLSLLRSLIADTGMAMVIVTHDLGVVADICDDVAVMYAGEIVESGSVDAVLDRASHPYTRALLRADPHSVPADELPDQLPSIRGTVPAPGAWPEGCRFANRCDFATAACSAVIPLTRRPEGVGWVRCVRAADLPPLDSVAVAESAGASPGATEMARASTITVRTGEKA